MTARSNTFVLCIEWLTTLQDWLLELEVPDHGHLLLREREPGWSDLTSLIDHLGEHACISYLELFMHPLHKQELSSYKVKL